ncbi:MULTISPECIES: hypothetical protein [unclassified Nonomuraea]|uniref:hypothetical protein n=1 Tax=unclassified Nonomuraea TaxID=2593643 RepID=UPI003411509F
MNPNLQPAPALFAPLAPLVGRWTVQAHVPGLTPAWSEFTWAENGLFLRQVSDIDEMPESAPQEWREHAPFPTTALIGLDDATGEFTMLYADARGVHRVYRMTFIDGVWRIWRNAPGFHQRFIGTLQGDTIDAQWELSKDGTTWNADFALTYTRTTA